VDKLRVWDKVLEERTLILGYCVVKNWYVTQIIVSLCVVNVSDFLRLILHEMIVNTEHMCVCVAVMSVSDAAHITASSADVKLNSGMSEPVVVRPGWLQSGGSCAGLLLDPVLAMKLIASSRDTNLNNVAAAAAASTSSPHDTSTVTTPASTSTTVTAAAAVVTQAT